MISYLEGEVELKKPGWVIIKTGGVGYKVSVTPSFSDTFNEGDSTKMYIYTQVREDILALYGFKEVSELDLFELLLSVSGIGPKAAIGILSAATPENITESIVRQDPTILSSVPGVGKKTAEKVVIELKNKVGATGNIFDNQNTGKTEDVYLALANLGFKPQEAREAMSGLPSECTRTEDQLKYCLANLKKK